MKTQLLDVKVGEIVVVNNVRTSFDPQKMRELELSIRENGILEPLLVRRVAGRITLVAGERRLRAGKAVGLKTVPCVLREMTDAAALEAQLVENLHREDMNPVDEAFGVKALYEKLAITILALGEKLGKSDFYVSQALRICELPKRTLDAVRAGRIHKTVAYEIAKLDTHALQVAATVALLPDDREDAGPATIRQACAVIRALRADDREAKPRSLPLRQPNSHDFRRFWKYWLLEFDAADFAQFKQICHGRYNEEVMAEAVEVVTREKNRRTAVAGTSNKQPSNGAGARL